MKVKRIALAVGLACSAGGSAFAAAPTSGAYVTDQQNEWVQEKLSDAIKSPNTIMCFMSALRADAMVNQGNYVALVDMEKCDSANRGKDESGSANAGASAATNYTRVVVNSSRTTNSDPMIAKVWFTMTEQGGSVTMFANASVTESPSTTNPNGQFSMNFCGVPANQADPLTGSCSIMQGSLAANGTTMTFTEAGNQGTPYVTKLTLSKSTDNSSGSGRIQSTDNGGVDGAFAFNSAYFKRGSAEPGKCFSRDRTLADIATWRYGVYNSDGSQLTLAHPGFPIKASSAGQSYWGYASFWGVFLPVLDSVTTVDRVTPGSNATTTYDLTKAGGKLYKLTKQAGTLDNIKGQPVMTWLPGNVVTGDASGGQYEISWNGSNLAVTRKQGACGQSGCAWTDLTASNYTVSAGALRTNAAWVKSLQGWSQGAGGEVRIDVPATGEFAGSTPIASRTRDVVVPGSAGAPTNLVCVNRCPKSGLQSSDFSSPNSPFQNININNWGGGGTISVNSEVAFQPVATGNALAYTFGADGLLKSGGNGVDASGLANLPGNYMSGLQSGRLLDPTSASYNAARCNSTNGYQQTGDLDSICPWMVENADVFYTYETGPNAWNRYVGLSSGGQAVTFDPPTVFPLIVTTTNTTVPANSPLLNSTVQLQFNGFGDLQGIPGKCINMNDNSEVACNGNNRWVPAFSIKDGTELSSGASKFYVKYLEREIHFARAADAASCSSLILPLSATLPGAPSTDARSITGAAPTVTDAPKVVHGVVK